MNEAAAVYFEVLRWVNALRPDVGPRWQQRDYHVIEAEARWKEAVAVTSEEVLEALRRCGVELPASTLRWWASAGLVTPPERYTVPGRPGRYADWPDGTPGEAAAAWALLRGRTALRVRWPMEAVRRARELGYRILSGITWDDLAAAGTTWGDLVAAREWLLVRSRVLAGLPYDQPIQLRVVRGTAVVEPSPVDVLTFGG